MKQILQDEIYERLRDVEETIRKTLPKIPEGVDTYDLQVEADLIDELLTRFNDDNEDNHAEPIILDGLSMNVCGLWV